MADKRIGFVHNSNKMREKWEDGVKRNKEAILDARALLATWRQANGWERCPEYMHHLEQVVKKQEQYYRNRYGEVLKA